MNYFATFVVLSTSITLAISKCDIQCPEPGQNESVCGFDAKEVKFKMFPSACTQRAYSECYKKVYRTTPLKFCITNQNTMLRRMYGESCPVFCPNHYRPVCGASKLRDYVYRTFNNGCYLDMINCRGDDDYSGFVEVPLQYCQNHLMKNIFKEEVVISNGQDYREY